MRAAVNEVKNPPIPAPLRYRFNQNSLSPCVVAKLIEFTEGEDQATNAFLDGCYDLNMMKEIAAPVLNFFFSLTDTNAILGCERVNTL